MKKILFVDASPRKNGNCSKAAELLTANVSDAEVEVFHLRDKKLGPCLACNTCKTQEKPACVQDDDLGALVKRLDEVDAIVVASPVYFGMVNAPAKAFLDRLYCFFAPGKPNNTLAAKLDKKAAMILTAGAGPADAYAVHGEAYIHCLATVGAKATKVLSCNGGNAPGAIWENADNLAQLKELAAWLVSDAE